MIHQADNSQYNVQYMRRLGVINIKLRNKIFEIKNWFYLRVLNSPDLKVGLRAEKLMSSHLNWTFSRKKNIRVMPQKIYCRGRENFPTPILWLLPSSKKLHRNSIHIKTESDEEILEDTRVHIDLGGSPSGWKIFICK